MTAQQFVDESIAWHRRALATSPIVEGVLVHGRAIAELRRVKRAQYRPPRIFVPFPLMRAFTEQLEQGATALAHKWSEGLLIVDGSSITLEPPTFEDAFARSRARLALERQLPFIETPNPPTTPIYALLREQHGWD